MFCGIRGWMGPSGMRMGGWALWTNHLKNCGLFKMDPHPSSSSSSSTTIIIITIIIITTIIIIITIIIITIIIIIITIIIIIIIIIIIFLICCCISNWMENGLIPQPSDLLFAPSRWAALDRHSLPSRFLVLLHLCATDSFQRTHQGAGGMRFQEFWRSSSYDLLKLWSHPMRDR